MKRWKRCLEVPAPIDRKIICLDERQHWLFVGRSNNNGFFENSSGFECVHGFQWWHELPQNPLKLDGYGFFDCRVCQPPFFGKSELLFLLYDGEIGFTEAEYWNHIYSTDVFSCKNNFKNPLYWLPYPKLPIVMYDVLQWEW